MPVNKYFQSFFNANEQNLYDGLQAEAIQIRGIDVQFIPRTLVDDDYLFGEDPVSTFDEFFTIEMYMENFEGFGQDTDIMAKIGLWIKDEAMMNVNVNRFREVTGLDKPLEGDLIFMPMAKALFEIRFVEDEEQFYALGKNYNWKLRCQLFEFSREDFDTGIEEVDSISNLDDALGIGGTEPHRDNEELETEGDAATNFDDGNPFGGY